MKTLGDEIKQAELQMLKLKKRILVTEQLVIAQQLERNKRELKEVVNQIKQSANPKLKGF